MLDTNLTFEMQRFEHVQVIWYNLSLRERKEMVRFIETKPPIEPAKLTPYHYRDRNIPFQGGEKTE